MDIGRNLQKYYANKWQATEGVADKLYTIAHNIEKGPTTFSEGDVITAIMKIKKISASTAQGTPRSYASSCRRPSSSRSSRIGSTSGRMHASADYDRYINVARGYARGKNTATPSVHRIRVITPQNTAQTIIDIILANRINSRVDEIFPKCSPTYWEGGRPKTQALDITCALGMLIERGLDDRSSVGIATMKTSATTTAASASPKSSLGSRGSMTTPPPPPHRRLQEFRISHP